MTRPRSANRRTVSAPRDLLLWGVSLAAMASALAPGGARGQSVGALMAATHQAAALAVATTPSSVTTAPLSPGMAAASIRALRYQAQVNQTLTLAQQAQAAAQAAAAALSSSVPNGLAPGGLQPVAHPVSAAADLTGLDTWQGANLPTASAKNPDQVTIVQTAPTAILSWQTFNVGRDTTLTFQQQLNGVAQPGWLVLNRVVGQLNPATGLRDPSFAPAPSQILGAIKADGTVLVINQNGIVFGATAQINVQSLVATSLEIGHALEAVNGVETPLTISQRNAEFLQYGLLGYAEQASANSGVIDTFSAQAVSATQYDPRLEGAVQVQTGATINSADGGFLMLIAPRVLNAGQLTSPDGEIALQSGRHVQLAASQGDAASIDPDVRGLVVTATNQIADPADYVENGATGILQADRGYVSIGATTAGAVLDAGFVGSTTSVSRNGYVNIFGGTIQLARDAVIDISPDDSPATIPQDPTSLQDFKSSRVRIGDAGALIDIGANSLIYAPSADISIGADPDSALAPSASNAQTTRVFVDTGAVIDAAGLTNVVIPASRNTVEISPVTANELADAPQFQGSFLNGATVYVDPRLSGVNANGVAWVGSPLISAASYAQQVGVTASELMTKGGNVTLGVAAYAPNAPGATARQSPDVIVKAGASIDISGGWKTYQAGLVRTSLLVNTNGQVVNISDANPDDTYIGVYTGFTAAQPRWGISQTYGDPLLTGSHYEGQYTEGLDAGSLTLKGSALVLDGKVYASAFAGPQQILGATPGTALGTVYGDIRQLQGASSQLPAGGYLDIQALGGGGDVDIVGAAAYAPLPTDFEYGQDIRFTASGNLVVPSRPADTVLPARRLDAISVDADALSQMGLSQITLQTSGAIDVTKRASVTLNPGGAFEALSGRGLTVDGSITAPGGAIDLTTTAGVGSVFVTEPVAPGAFDIVINGRLNVSGRWANDYDAAAGRLVGAAYLNGGEITLNAAPRVTSGPAITFLPNSQAPQEITDDSGSILVDTGAVLNVSGGGYVAPNGTFDLSAKGGNLSLYDDTSYFQLLNNGSAEAGAISGFRVDGVDVNGANVVSINPGAITAHVSLAAGAILAQGFAGGGTFTLTTPQFAFGPTAASVGAALPLDFFSRAGFANYNITSYKTDLISNAFNNDLGGYNAVLATQVLTVAKGQTLLLSQSMFSPLLDTAQISALRGLATGSSLYSVLSPVVPADAWDSRPVNLTLGGAMELHVAKGGTVQGEAGGVLTVGGLYNQGVIRIPGGTINQSEVLPSAYAGSSAIGVHSLSNVFTTQADGVIDASAPNALGIALGSVVLTNGQLAAQADNLTDFIYLLGDLNAGEGVRLAKGSVTDLSGEAIINPRAAPMGGVGSAAFRGGVVVAGGTLDSQAAFANGTAPHGAFYTALSVGTAAPAEQLNAQPGSHINLAGAQAIFDEPVVAAASTGPAATYAPTRVWSDGGALILGAGGTLTGADIQAQGGAPLALGGTLTVLDPVLYQADPATPTFDAISAKAVTRAGFASFVAEGGLTSVGNVVLTLPRSVFVETPTTFETGGATASDIADQYSPVIGSGGRLEISAPYIALDGAFQSVTTPLYGALADNSLILRADSIDITGAVVFDQSVGRAIVDATQSVRLIGVAPSAIGATGPLPATLAGQLAVNGDLTLRAGQIYPTTGSSFSITSAAARGLITFASMKGASPAAPYSAGGSLLIQANRIHQDGVVRVPLGSLTLGGDAPLESSDGSTTMAPATTAVVLGRGSVTSVSADGLVIPYGTTTDQTEWYFTPTDNNPLTAPPAGVLQLSGRAISVQQGATVDLKGGGDVYAYEFIPGTGGSRDVLSQFNTDAFSSNNGYQYPDRRQIYAIVPGLSNAAIAATDPIYSSNYSSLYGPSQAGMTVYLNAGPGLKAGWYTLLPAQYALLPGGMRVVEDASAATPPPVGGTVLADGTVVTSGRFGVAGTDFQTAALTVFDVQSQAVINRESDIALTYGAATFAADAAHNGALVPQLPIDAGRLILNPVISLALGASFETDPAGGGRGSEVDISGRALTIEAAGVAPPVGGGVVLSDSSLANLNAASLFIGGTRTDNADGTTSLDVTTTSITVGAGATLSAPEIILATDGLRSHLTVDKGAAIIATGSVTDAATGDYVIDGLAADGVTRIQTGEAAVLRVSNGPDRLINRQNIAKGAPESRLDVRAADLEGASVELESAGALLLNSNARIKAAALVLGAGQISFGTSGPGLVITPKLETLLSEAQSLTLETPEVMTFAPGVYSFGNISLDTPGLALGAPGAVTLKAGDLQIANSGPALTACGAAGALACGGGSLTLAASQIAFATGQVNTYGAGGGVTLTAQDGVFADGVAVFDVGHARLAIDTPFLGDRGPGVAAPSANDLTAVNTIPSLTLTTAGDIAIADRGPAAAFTAPGGTPGASLILNGRAVSIVGTQVRATAGDLTVNAATSIAISGGAVLATPGFAEVFGDSADPVTESAPGGLLSLTAAHGNISISTDSRLSVGGAAGAAGTLSLTAQNGQVYAYDGAKTVALSTVLEASAPGGGGTFALDTGGAFDLSAFAEADGALFTGGVQVRSGKGNLQLMAGDTLAAASVTLVADGGQIIDGGAVNTLGVNGGDVDLYGAGGVHLLSSALIEATAQGYGPTDSRQAHGGDVILGVDGSGAITVDKGALIDVAALHPGNRLVPMDRSNGTYFAYAAGDTGGTVTFRAPVITASGVETVNVAVGGSVQGASSVVLEGFKRFDLGALANNPGYVGITVSNGTATLDLGAAAAGKINPLTDNAAGTLVNFIQAYDVSADYAALGGLAGQANFHARPGVDLAYSGNIVLKSNWNLGAGVVNVAGAVAAGLMTPIASLPGQYAVVPGDEGRIFADYTTLTYRVGGLVTGEPGVLTLQAGGNLDIKGSITDGFFQFRDQTDPGYLSLALGGGNPVYQASLPIYCANGDCSGVPGWTPNHTPGNYVLIDFPGSNGLSASTDLALPYSADTNTPSAPGSLPGGQGDSLGSAELFPLLPTSHGGSQAVSSWSYQLVAGADLKGSDGAPSVDLLTTVAGSNRAVVVSGQHVYSYSAEAGQGTFAGGLELQDNNGTALTADQWYQAFVAENPGLKADSYTTISYGDAGGLARPILQNLAAHYFKAHPGEARFISGGVTTRLSDAAQFMAFVSANFSQLTSAYHAPADHAVTRPTYATAATLVRTGTGDIQIAASGDINLQNGATPTLLNKIGQLLAVTNGGPQLGGTAVYTAGTNADLGMTTATDEATGKVLSVDLASALTTGNVFSQTSTAGYASGETFTIYGAPLYSYGAPSQIAAGFAGILIANPVYAQGGGDVSLNAGLDVLGRRDTFQENRLGGVGGAVASGLPFWVGTGAQPWRTGQIGTTVNAQIDPQLFQEGVGTLAGGDITVRAGRSISDLSIVSTDSLVTADVSSPGAGGVQPLALASLGGGDTTVWAGQNLLGGRLDVAYGAASLIVHGDIASAGTISETSNFTPYTVDNSLRVRLSDATVDISSAGQVDLQGITALGVSAQLTGEASLDAKGFYSANAGVSIRADGPVSIANAGLDIVTDNQLESGDTASAVYPGSLRAISFTGGLNISTAAATTLQRTATEVILYPSPTGTLTLLAAGNIAPLTLSMDDGDPSLLPGAFTTFTSDSAQGVISGRPFLFPAVLPDTSDVVLRTLHNSRPTHAGDPTPDRIVAGGDITDMIINTPKQTRIDAGRDIINMVFLGQNLAASDITRIVAGRDITATTALEAPLVSITNGLQYGVALPAVQGDTFVLGGPGALFVEAGRDAGPFLNSAVTNGFQNGAGGASVTPTGFLSYAGGIITVGNLSNPWLPAQGADIFTAFGVSKGQDFSALDATYLAPGNFANLPGYLFQQTTDANGDQIPDRTEEIYSLSLIDWMKSIAPQIISSYDVSAGVSSPGTGAPALVQFAQSLQAGKTVTFAQALSFLPQVADDRMPLIPWLLLHDGAALTAAYGNQDVSYQQAYAAFQDLPALTQREFLLKDVYFNELIQTSIPASSSYLQYSRGYQAVNTLFPGTYGYTQNSLSGGPAGASTTVQTGNLDLRLATIQTEEGGDVVILGPGGRVLAGSTVSTSVQASRRAYEGGLLYSGGAEDSPITSDITQIPVGYEGIITLRGGALDSFTDGDFLLNQSRAFTEQGGDIAIWSSNADVNAGQGPKTSANFPPVVVRVDQDGYSEVNQAGSVSGAGIAAFQPDPTAPAPDVFLMAPRGTVDAGAGGVRSAGNVFIAAFQVANADNVQAQGAVSGVQGPAAVNVQAQTGADAASTAAAQAAQNAASAQGQQNERPLIFVDVLGYLADELDSATDDDQKRGKKR